MFFRLYFGGQMFYCRHKKESMQGQVLQNGKDISDEGIGSIKTVILYYSGMSFIMLGTLELF